MKTKVLLLFLLLSAQLGLAATYSVKLTVIGLPGPVDTFAAEMSNLGSENEVNEQTVSLPNGQQTVVKSPARLRWLDITFKRGMTSSLDLANWRKLVEDGNVVTARKNATITIYDASLHVVAQWQLNNAWPVSLTLEQNSDGSFVEVLRIVHEGMTRVQI